MNTRRAVIAVTMLLSVARLSGDLANALEIVDAKKAPAWYATEVVRTDKDGKETKTVVFSSAAVAFSPYDFDRVLGAYGATIVNGKALPSSFGTEIVSKDKDGKDVRSVTFSSAPVGMAPAYIDSVLAAYGLRIVDGKKLPEGYGREVTVKDKDGKDAKQTVFSPSAFRGLPSSGTRCSPSTAASPDRARTDAHPPPRPLGEKCPWFHRLRRG